MSNTLLFRILYLLGLLLLVTGFLLFIPENWRTDIGWMNFGIICFLYTGIWGKYSLLYRARSAFATGVPAMSTYWLSYGLYALASVVAMLLLSICRIGFEKQAFIQAVLLFLFVAVVVVGLCASNFLASEESRTKRDVGGVRNLQSRFRQLRISMCDLPPEYTCVKTRINQLVDEVDNMGGCNNPMAKELEMQIENAIVLLDEVLQKRASVDDCLAAVNTACKNVALRKEVRNV